MNDELITILSKLPNSKHGLELDDSKFKRVREELRDNGFDLRYDRSSKTWNVDKGESVSSSGLERVVSDVFTKEGISVDEASRLIKLVKKPNHSENSYSKTKLDIPDKHIKYGVISDTHMGSKDYRPDILEHAVNKFNREGVDFVLHIGDILEGMSGRDGHIYELTHIGATAQMNYAVEQLSQIKQKVYGITATNSHDGWFSSKGNTGFEVGPELDGKIENFNFIGYDEVDIETDGGAKIRLLHPGGGTSYAISYKMQKYINSLSGGDKPQIIHQGHFHKLNYLFYRNIHAFDAGALQAQTSFMKKQGSPSMLGYTIVDLFLDKDSSVNSIKPEFVTFYDSKVDTRRV